MTVYLDTCFSGHSGNGPITKNISGLSVEIRLPKTPEKIVVVSAAQGGQSANWDVKARFIYKTSFIGVKGSS